MNRSLTIRRKAVGGKTQNKRKSTRVIRMPDPTARVDIAAVRVIDTIVQREGADANPLLLMVYSMVRPSLPQMLQNVVGPKTSAGRAALSLVKGLQAGAAVSSRNRGDAA